jgi:hypothetical protein
VDVLSGHGRVWDFGLVVEQRRGILRRLDNRQAVVSSKLVLLGLSAAVASTFDCKKLVWSCRPPPSRKLFAGFIGRRGGGLCALYGKYEKLIVLHWFTESKTVCFSNYFFYSDSLPFHVTKTWQS